jgi:hypothetical protein
VEEVMADASGTGTWILDRADHKLTLPFLFQSSESHPSAQEQPSDFDRRLLSLQIAVTAYWFSK